MAIYRLLENAAFEPEHIQALSQAYEMTLSKLGIVGRDDPVCQVIAKKIIDRAQTNELNPIRLSELTIQELGLEPRE